MNTQTKRARSLMRTPAIFLILAAIGVSLAGLPVASPPASASAQEQVRPEAIEAGSIPLIISEFRVRGPNGSTDEFVEIYNYSDLPHTVAGGGNGYGLVAGGGVLRFTIPNGIVIPARGHFLGVNIVGYSLGANAPGDITFSTDILDQAGIALFTTNQGAGFTLANRIDAVGPVGEVDPLFREGAGLPTLIGYSNDYSWVRPQSYGCSSLPRDTDNNANDFRYVDTNGTSAGAGQRLGAPGPQNLVKAVGAHPGVVGFTQGAMDPGVGRSVSPNLVRELSSSPANNSTFGRLDIRRKFTNTTGTPITSLRFRITDIATFPQPNGMADLRPITSTDTIVAISAAGGGGTSAVRGTSIDAVPDQPNGGGINTTFNVPAITAATPLAVGASINLRFWFGLQQTGAYHIGLSVESFPVGDKNVTWYMTGKSDPATIAEPCSVNTRRADFDGDGKSDISLWRGGVGTWYSLNSTNGAFAQTQFGAAGDRVVPGDYDGDGTTDLAVWRTSNSVWYILNSTTGFTFTSFGLAADFPTPGDFDGDGRTDIAVFRPGTGMWYVLRSSGGLMSVPFGANGDKPVVGDYDNDGKADVAVFRPLNGTWYVQQSSAGLMGVQFGIVTDKVVPADYDGDGKTDIAVYRASAGAWYLNLSGSGFTAVNFGIASDVPAPGDFDLDGKADVSVFRPSTGIWYRLNSSNGTLATSQFGQNGDTPVLAGYVPVQ